jgi:hypothetical protein
MSTPPLATANTHRREASNNKAARVNDTYNPVSRGRDTSRLPKPFERDIRGVIGLRPTDFPLAAQTLHLLPRERAVAVTNRLSANNGKPPRPNLPVSGTSNFPKFSASASGPRAHFQYPAPVDFQVS